MIERIGDKKYTNESISKSTLWKLIENESILKITMDSSHIPDKQKMLLDIGVCIVEVPNDPIYAIYTKKAFENGSFTFVD